MTWVAHIRIGAGDGLRNIDFSKYANDADDIHDLLWLYRAPSVDCKDPVYSRFFWDTELGLCDEAVEHPRGKFL